jgi:signal transduction histidine kinase
MTPRWLAGSRALARRLLPLTMGVVVAIFVASTIYSQVLLTSDVEAFDIASNSAPSIADLANARAQLRALEREADRIVAAEDQAAADRARATYADHRRVIDAALTQYLKTPDYPGEHELFAHVPAGLAALDALVADGQAARPSDRVAAQRRIETAIDELESSMHAVSELNRRELLKSAQEIARIGRRKNVYAFVLDGLGIVVAFIATMLAARTVERFIATMRRRAREIEHLAIQVGHEIANPLMPIMAALRMLEQRDGDEEQQRTALARARRSLQRIEESIGRLATFAQAGVPSNDPLPRTLLAPALAAAAGPAGAGVAIDPTWHVAVPEPTLQDLLADLFAGCVPPGGAPLAAVAVRASRDHVRLTLERPTDGDGAHDPFDPFDPQLHVPGMSHPGIDLRLAKVRRQVEACGGAVGARRGKNVQRLWIELPRA